MMLIGENSRLVVEKVKAEIQQLKNSLPTGVTIEPLYDRTHLIDHTLGTVKHNLAAGGALVIAVLLLLLGNLRGGLIVALAIPLSVLFAANMMLASGISASLMSLGADRLRPDRRFRRDRGSRTACDGWGTRGARGPSWRSSATPPSRCAARPCSAS